MEKFQGARVKTARLSMGLSLDGLVEKITESGEQITKQAISQFENGNTVPAFSTVDVLSSVLKKDFMYFFTPHALEVSDINFRSGAGMAPREEEQIKVSVLDEVEKYIEFFQIVDEEVPVPKLPSVKVENIEDIEQIVVDLRNKWGLGLEPIESISKLLDGLGLRVIEIAAGDRFDGISMKINGNIPIIAINKKMTVFRKRFTLLHELAHIILDTVLEESDKKSYEKLCHRFAGAFLMPEEKYREEFHNIVSLKNIPLMIPVKENFGISLAAMAVRAKDLGIVKSQECKVFFDNLRENKMEDGLGKYLGEEMTSSFESKVMLSCIGKKVSFSKAAMLLGYTVDDFFNKIYVANEKDISISGGDGHYGPPK